MSLLLRSTLDLSDRLASKATSDPIIEAMLEEHPDPFDSYRLESDETRDVFTVLPPMNLGLGSSSGGGAGKKVPLETDRETVKSGNGHERRASMDSTASPRREGKKAMTVSEVLGLDQKDEGDRPTTTNGTPKRATQAGTNNDHDDEDQDGSGESGFLSSKPTTTEPRLDEIANSIPVTPTDSPALTTPTHDPFSEPSLTDESAPFVDTRPAATRTTSSKAREHGRRLSKVTEVEPVETDPMSGDWSNPGAYERSLSSGLNGRDGYESGEVRFSFFPSLSLSYDSPSRSFFAGRARVEGIDCVLLMIVLLLLYLVVPLSFFSHLANNSKSFLMSSRRFR